MKKTPIELFNQLHKEELHLTKVRIHSACCLSTLGTEGFPNARFVSLKDITENKFIITGPLTSRKGIEINAINKVALTFWWTETERQVRLQGNASKIDDQLADKYFTEHNRDSQLVSLASELALEIDRPENLTKKYENLETGYLNKALKRPKN